MGIEAYVRIFARVWDLLGGSSQPPYWTGDETKDLRLLELKPYPVEPQAPHP